MTGERAAIILQLALACVLLTFACATRPVPLSWKESQSASLRDHLARLDPSVNPNEAARLAETAIEQSDSLALEYQAVRAAWVGNWLVNYGWRERGLCYDWPNDLYPRLHALDLQTLQLHLAVAHMDTPREHNALVITATGQPFEHGVVLDAWRYSGRLWFGPASADKYPWSPLPRDRVAPELQKFLAP
jgi:hypothetical protein